MFDLGITNRIFKTALALCPIEMFKTQNSDFEMIIDENCNIDMFIVKFDQVRHFQDVTYERCCHTM
jgi:hypothetical protein